MPHASHMHAQREDVPDFGLRESNACHMLVTYMPHACPERRHTRLWVERVTCMPHASHMHIHREDIPDFGLRESHACHMLVTCTSTEKTYQTLG